jgi:integrase/recombinase XerD
MRMFFIFDRHHMATNEKEANVELRVYFGRHSEKSISTGVKLYADQWDNMVVDRVDSVQLNRQLHLFKKKDEDAIHSMQVDGLEVNLENFNAYIAPKKDMADNFIDFMYEELQNSNIRDSTKRQHLVAFQALERFEKIKSFSSLTLRNIELFDNFIRNEEKRTQTTIFGYHERIKPYVNKAYCLGYISENPYLKFKNNRGQYKERIALTQDELDQLLSMKFENKLSRVADLFILQCYAGLSYADTQIFNFEKETVKGKDLYFIDGRRYVMSSLI